MTHPSQETIGTTAAAMADVAIIGAGPAGLFAVFACGMLGLKTRVFDALPEIGGQCTALYPEKPIYDIPAYPAITAGDLIEKLAAQAAPFAPDYRLGSPVTDIQENEDRVFTLTTAAGESFQARAILIATGGGAFGPNRPPLDQIEQYENKSVFYAVQDPARFDGKTLVIAGGGDSAVDWANLLAGQAKKIYLVHRRETFRAAPQSLAQLEKAVAAGNIEKMVPFQLDALIGERGQISTVRVRDLDGAARDLPADALLCFYGLSTTPGVVDTLGLTRADSGIVIDPATGRTSRAGFYAAGDCAAYPHKRKLILTGFSECAGAAHAIYTDLHPDTPLHHEHSTTRGIPGPA